MNRRKSKRPGILKWIGNMTILSDYLNEKSWFSGWGPIKVIDTYCRALGVVVFACNPLSGILIFSGLMLGNPLIALTTFVASTIAIITCKLLGAPNLDVCSGLAVFNSILLGGVVTAVAPMVLEVPYDIHFWIFLAVGAAITVFVDQGLQSLMSPSRLPVQSVPFNIVAAILLLVLRAKLKGFDLEINIINMDEENALLNMTSSVEDQINWTKVLQGTVMATGQIYGIESLRGSILVWFGYLLYSPILAIFLYMGSIIGGIGAVLVDVAPLNEVYVGLWSYNSMLAGGAIAFFVVPSPLSVVTAVVNAILTVAVQAAVTPLFMQTSVPVFSYPFNVAVMLILAISLRKESPLKFVFNKTFPEEHVLKFYNICGSESEDLELSESDLAVPFSISAKFDSI